MEDNISSQAVGTTFRNAMSVKPPGEEACIIWIMNNYEMCLSGLSSSASVVYIAVHFPYLN